MMTTMTTTKERPILFSDAMVRAILSGTKTQTRRVVKPHPEAPAGWYPDAYNNTDKWAFWGPRGTKQSGCCTLPLIKFPYGRPGLRLWVREAFCPILPQDPHYNGGEPIAIDYRATHGPDSSQWRMMDEDGSRRWKPSIHMPRAASRIMLEIVSVRIERLGDISEHDALAEGIYSCRADGLVRLSVDGSELALTGAPGEHRTAFRSLWESVGGRWADNPWVWVVEFRRVSQ